MYFTVEERKPDISSVPQRRPPQDGGKSPVALPDMDKEMAALAGQTADKLDTMSDADFAAQRFHFSDE